MSAPRRTGASRAARTAMGSVSAVLITLVRVLVPVSLLAVWVHDIVLDTGPYVSTVSPLASDLEADPPNSAVKASPATAAADHKHSDPAQPEQRAAQPAALPLSQLPGAHARRQPTRPQGTWPRCAAPPTE
ncbi:hypothetical protein ACFRJ1_05315 [Streptomyces sp. NPDC056773]|uniref:hypothetical protein n=1 Tax=unclassified Streptomyces TaxID=2593676 RepID=UPI003691ECC3